MTGIIQRMLGGGEVSPSLYRRHDLAKFGTWLRTCRNFLPLRSGAVANRPGTPYVGEAKFSTKRTRLLPFIFNSEANQVYALEFGDLYIRFHHAVKQESGLYLGEQILETAKSASISQASPAVVTSVAHGYADGDEVRLVASFPGMTGMPGIMNQNYRVIAINADTFGLRRLSGVNLDTTAVGPYVAGTATVARVYQVVSPYLAAEVFEINFAQSADVVFLAHHLHPLQELTRFGETNWTLAATIFEPAIAPPHGGSATIVTGGTNSWRYKLTAIDKNTREESLPGREQQRVITNITQANPAVVTSNGHGYQNGERVLIQGVVGMTQVNGLEFVVAGQTANTFQLSGVDSTGYSAYGSGGTAERLYIAVYSAGEISTTNPVTITFPAVSGAGRYAIYRAQSGGEYAFVGYALESPFIDRLAVPPDANDSPPAYRNPFTGAGNYPSVVAIIQQRLMLGGSDNDPERSWGSETGRYRNFSLTFPVADDGALNFIVGTGQVNRVRALLELNSPVLWTDGAEHELQGNQSGTLTPDAPNIRQNSANGIAAVRPLPVNAQAIYVQAQGSVVRALGFKIEHQGYSGDELTIYSSHLVDGHQIVDWCYQKTPTPIVWAVREDGVLLSMTYNIEQEIFSWAHHDTDGLVESVCAIPEGAQTGVWLVVQRTIGGRQVRMIERMAPRGFILVGDSVVLDSARTYDGRNHQAGATVRLYDGTTWADGDTVKIGVLGGLVWRADHVGMEVHVRGSVLVRVRITSVDTIPMIPVAYGTADKDVPASMRNVQLADWGLATNTISNLSHLEGKDVSALGDGFVLASPNNPNYSKLTVLNGAVTFEHYFTVIHVGLPYTSDFETLDVDSAQGVSIADEAMLLRFLTIFLESTRGLWVGPKPPAADAEHQLVGLKPLRLREQKTYDDVPELVTGPVTKGLMKQWNSNGRVFVRQVDPIPATILALSREGVFPFTG